MDSDGEFDKEAYSVYEDELYKEESISSNEDELDSEVEETLYGQVHYASSLVVSDEVTPGQEIQGNVGVTVNKQVENLKAENCLGIPVIEISSDDEKTDLDVEDTSCNYPEVIKIFSDDFSTKEKNPLMYPVIPRENEGIKKVEENRDLDNRDLLDPTTSRKLSRYYTGNARQRLLHLRCYNCNQRGHLSQNCPEPKKVAVCYLCGLSGHVRKFCPNDLCFNCQEPGHQSKQCRQPRVRPFDRCRRCHMTGHLAKVCPDVWRQYHVTTQVGPVAIPTNYPSPRQAVFCYNCGKEGHYGHECTEHFENWNGILLPFVVRYDSRPAFVSRTSRDLHCKKRKARRETKDQTRFDRRDVYRQSYPREDQSRDYPRDSYERVEGYEERDLLQPPPEKKTKWSKEKQERNVSVVSNSGSQERGKILEPRADRPSPNAGKKKSKKNRKRNAESTETLQGGHDRRVVEIINRSPVEDSLIKEPCQVKKKKKRKQKLLTSGECERTAFEDEMVFQQRRQEKQFLNSSSSNNLGTFQRKNFDSRNHRKRERCFFTSRGFRFSNTQETRNYNNLK